MYQNAGQPQTYASPRVEVRPLLRNVYALMTLGLLVTAVVAYLTAKEVDPSCKIHVTGTSYWWDQKYGREQWYERF